MMEIKSLKPPEYSAFPRQPQTYSEFICCYVIRPHHMRSIYAAYFYKRGGVVGQWICRPVVTIVSPAKAAEPIETLLRGADALDQEITYQIRVFIGATWRIQWIDLCGDVARIIVVTYLQPNLAILSDLII